MPSVHLLRLVRYSAIKVAVDTLKIRPRKNNFSQELNRTNCPWDKILDILEGNSKGSKQYSGVPLYCYVLGP